MNIRKAINTPNHNPLPIKPIIYTSLLIFLLFTSYLSFTTFKFKIYPNTLQNLTSKQCTIPESKRDLIQNLEPLIKEEPLEIWEGLGKDQENKIKYLPSMIDLNTKKRFIYIDLGAREFDSSIGNWFLKQYPKQGKAFEIYAVEADKAFHGQYERKSGVTLIPFAAWIRNETVVFGSKPIVVNDKVWRMRPFGRIEGAKAEEDKMSAVTKVQAFDFVDWLKRTVRETDFVVVKIDIEGTEIKLVRELIERGSICLIDELFMECHFDRFVKCCSGERINRFNYSYGQCYDLFSELRNRGVVVHQWW